MKISLQNQVKPFNPLRILKLEDEIALIQSNSIQLLKNANDSFNSSENIILAQYQNPNILFVTSQGNFNLLDNKLKILIKGEQLFDKDKIILQLYHINPTHFAVYIYPDQITIVKIIGQQIKLAIFEITKNIQFSGFIFNFWNEEIYLVGTQKEAIFRKKQKIKGFINFAELIYEQQYLICHIDDEIQIYNFNECILVHKFALTNLIYFIQYSNGFAQLLFVRQDQQFQFINFSNPNDINVIDVEIFPLILDIQRIELQTYVLTNNSVQLQHWQGDKQKIILKEVKEQKFYTGITSFIDIQNKYYGVQQILNGSRLLKIQKIQYVNQEDMEISRKYQEKISQNANIVTTFIINQKQSVIVMKQGTCLVYEKDKLVSQVRLNENKILWGQYQQQLLIILDHKNTYHLYIELNHMSSHKITEKSISCSYLSSNFKLLSCAYFGYIYLSSIKDNQINLINQRKIQILGTIQDCLIINEEYYLLGSRQGKIMVFNQEQLDVIYQLDNREILKNIQLSVNGYYFMKTSHNDYLIDINLRKCSLFKIKNSHFFEQVQEYQFLVKDNAIIAQQNTTQYTFSFEKIKETYQFEEVNIALKDQKIQKIVYSNLLDLIILITNGFIYFVQNEKIVYQYEVTEQQLTALNLLSHFLVCCYHTKAKIYKIIQRTHKNLNNLLLQEYQTLELPSICRAATQAFINQKQNIILFACDNLIHIYYLKDNTQYKLVSTLQTTKFASNIIQLEIKQLQPEVYQSISNRSITQFQLDILHQKGGLMVNKIILTKQFQQNEEEKLFAKILLSYSQQLNQNPYQRFLTIENQGWLLFTKDGKCHFNKEQEHLIGKYLLKEDSIQINDIIMGCSEKILVGLQGSIWELNQEQSQEMNNQFQVIHQ